MMADFSPGRVGIRPALSIAHGGELRGGGKLTPLFQAVTVRVGMKKRKTAATVPTVPTLPGGFRQRGRKIDPPLLSPACVGIRNFGVVANE